MEQQDKLKKKFKLTNQNLSSKKQIRRKDLLTSAFNVVLEAKELINAKYI